MVVIAAQRHPGLRFTHRAGAGFSFFSCTQRPDLNQRVVDHTTDQPGVNAATRSARGMVRSSRVRRFLTLASTSPVWLRCRLTVLAALSSCARLNCLSDFAGMNE